MFGLYLVVYSKQLASHILLKNKNKRQILFILFIYYSAVGAQSVTDCGFDSVEEMKNIKYIFHFLDGVEAMHSVKSFAPFTHNGFRIRR